MRAVQQTRISRDSGCALPRWGRIYILWDPKSSDRAMFFTWRSCIGHFWTTRYFRYESGPKDGICQGKAEDLLDKHPQRMSLSEPSEVLSRWTLTLSSGSSRRASSQIFCLCYIFFGLYNPNHVGGIFRSFVGVLYTSSASATFWLFTLPPRVFVLVSTAP